MALKQKQQSLEESNEQLKEQVRQLQIEKQANFLTLAQSISQQNK